MKLLTSVDALPTLRPGQRPVPRPGELELWYCFYEHLDEASLLAEYDLLLNEEERARHRRLYFAKDRHQFLVTRALVRCVLSQYADVEPAAWRFGKNEHGRPHIEASEPLVHFNLSNTAGLIACAVSGGEAVGVDVEATDRRTEPNAIAHRFFSRAEAETLLALPTAGEQRQRFFSLWTLKEAYIKARGMGLAIPLGSFSFSFDAQQSIRIGFAPTLDDDPTRWQFALLRASPRHLLALAHGDGVKPMRVSAAEVVPLRDVPAPPRHSSLSSTSTS